MAYQTIRALIWGKTYPELSSKYVETVCTGAVREDGSPIRLYPVPLRYLDGSKRYGLYDWIEVPIEKSSRDPRPESFKVQGDAIRVVEHVDTTDHWRERREVIFRDTGWQFESVAELKSAQRSVGRSMGIVSVRSIESVAVENRAPHSVTSSIRSTRNSSIYPTGSGSRGAAPDLATSVRRRLIT